MRNTAAWISVVLVIAAMSIGGCVAGQPVFVLPSPAPGPTPTQPASAIEPTAHLPATVPPSPMATRPPTDTPQPTATSTPVASPTVVLGVKDTSKLTDARLVAVVDGVTLDVTIKGQPHRVRYIGIEPLGDGAAAVTRNKQLVAGQALKLESDVLDADPQGNLLRYVWGKTYMLNAELARLGLARVIAMPPDTRYQELLTKMEQEARKANRGLWAPVKAATPSVLRKAPTTTRRP